MIPVVPPWLAGLGMLLLALAYDLALGEFPAAIHPVVWVGRLIGLLEKAAPASGQWRQLVYGAGMVLVTGLALTAGTWAAMAYLSGASQPLQIVAGALLLKSTFSLRELFQAARRVQYPLAEGKLDEARESLRSLVSRDTAKLSRPLLAAAAVESVAENSSDSFIAPLLYFSLFGLPGAVAYRVVNTFDSMIGYHGRYEYLGKFAARLDDAANWLPARLTSLLLVAACRLAGGHTARVWKVIQRHHSRTESPNAGWPMAAMAGALGVQLEKVGHYRLGEGRRPPSPESIEQSIYLARTACLAGLVILALLYAAIGVFANARLS